MSMWGKTYICTSFFQLCSNISSLKRLSNNRLLGLAKNSAIISMKLKMKNIRLSGRIVKVIRPDTG